MADAHRLALLGRVGGQQVLGGLLRPAVARVVDVVERAELGPQRLAGNLGLASTFVGDRDVMVGDALDGLAHLVVEEEHVALLRDIPRGLGVANQDEDGRTLDGHVVPAVGRARTMPSIMERAGLCGLTSSHDFLTDRAERPGAHSCELRRQSRRSDLS